MVTLKQSRSAKRIFLYYFFSSQPKQFLTTNIKLSVSSACKTPVAIWEFLYLIMIYLFMLQIRNFIRRRCIIIQKDQAVERYPFSQIDERFQWQCSWEGVLGVVMNCLALVIRRYLFQVCVLVLYQLKECHIIINQPFQAYDSSYININQTLKSINQTFIINLIITRNTFSLHQMATQTQPSLINFIKQHPLASVLTVGSVSAAVLYYMTLTPKPTKQPATTPLRKRIKTQPATQHNSQKQQAQIQHQLNHLKSTREKLITAAQSFKIEYLQEQILTSLLTEQCLLDLFDQCIQLVDEQQLNRIYETSRKARRTIFAKILINAEIKQMNRKQSLQSLKSHQPNEPSFLSPMEMTTPRNLKSIKHMLQNNTPITYPEALTFSQMYYRFVCTFQEEFKYLIEKTQKDFATFLNLDFNVITESIDFHISKEDNDYFKLKIEEWTSAIRESLKPKLVKYVSPIQPNKIKLILQYQVKYLTEKRQKLRETIQKLGISNEEQLDALPTLLATILQDEVFEKFAIQQQQMTVETMHLSKNKELQALVEQFQLLTQAIAQEMYQEVNKDAIIDDQGDDP